MASLRTLVMYNLLGDYIATNVALRSPESKRLLKLAVDRFADFYGENPPTEALTDRNLAAFVQWRRAAGRKEPTIERELSKLLTLARYGAMHGLCPLVRTRIVKAPLDPPVAFLRWQVRALWRAAAHYRPLVRGVRGDVYFLAVLNVIWDTGERIGAVLQIERHDVDLSGRWITIRHRKQGGPAMVRRLRRSTVKSLHRLLEAHQSPLVFGEGHRTSLYHHFDAILVAAGLPATSRHKFHCLRRTHASWLHRVGGDARESLGHHSEQLTRERYFDRRIVGRGDAAEKLFNPSGWWCRLLAVMGW